MKSLVRIVAIIYYISYVIGEIYLTWWILVNRISFWYWLLYSIGLFFGCVVIAGLDYAVSRISDSSSKRLW